MGLADLKQITSNLNQPAYENLIVDFKDNDDSGIYDLGDKLLVQSLDFITPIVDDLGIYGEIAASNSLSDVYAKNARAITAMSILMWDKTHLSTMEANEILNGALKKLIESKCALIGGHSIVDSEQKFGLSVSGIIEDGIFWRNNTAKIGDCIILTKPLGSGILSSALKANLFEFSPTLDFVKSMRALNLQAALLAKKFNINACSDVTGFGLIGHLNEMINEKISIKLHSNSVKIFSRVKEFVELGAVPGGSYANKTALEGVVKSSLDFRDIIFYDAQTSGGLLIALNEREAFKLNEILNDNGIDSSIIAEVVLKGEYRIYLD